ncbi:MAG TPA: fibronectin type III domain-containing protein, partial [Gemmatimonadaceae bacterium]
MSRVSGTARLFGLAILAAAAGSCTETTDPATLGAPTNVTVTMLTPTSARISWAPPVDTGLVINYNVFRDGSEIGESATTFYVDAGLAEGITYKYRVSANGVQGLLSELSAESPAATITVPDVTAPSVIS